MRVRVAVLALSLVALAGLACSDRNSAPTPPVVVLATLVPATPLPTFDPSSNAVCDRSAEVCAVAQELLAQLKAGDFEAMLAGAEPSEWVCPGPVTPEPGAHWPFCRGAQAGEVRFGFGFGRFGTDGAVVDAGGFAEGLGSLLAGFRRAKTDELGSGELALATVGCATQAVREPRCEGNFVVVLTSITVAERSDPYRIVLMFGFAGSSNIASSLAWFSYGHPPDLALLRGGRADYGYVHPSGRRFVVQTWWPVAAP